MANSQSAPGAGNSSNTAVMPAPGAVSLDTGNATSEQANKMQTNANLMAKYGAGNYDITAAGDVVQKSSPVGIVTSKQSQTTYNQNVADMNNANTALKNSIQAQIDKLQGQVTNANNAGYGVGGANAGKDVPDKVLNPPTDGSTIMTDANGNNYTVPPGMDTSIASSLINNLDVATSEITSYQKQIETLGSYDVNTDPVAMAAAQSIKDSYDVLIKQMENKNKILMGSITTNAARSGALQYANEMDSMYKNAEFDAATQRITDLKQKETDAINKSNEAYKSGNVKMLEQASKDLNAAQAEGRNALLDLQKTIDSTIKSNQAQAKIDAAEAKAQQTSDITVSKSIAQAALDALEAAGITDPASLEYANAIQQIADEQGISNPTILQGQIATLNPASGTAALKNKNIISTINKRNQPKTSAPTKPKVDGGFTYTPADVFQGATILNKGATMPDGTVLGGRGSEYVNTGTYNYMYHNWVDVNNGTPAGFLKEYPVVGNVNPADYGSLPANIRPKAATGTTGFTVTPAQ